MVSVVVAAAAEDDDTMAFAFDTPLGDDEIFRTETCFNLGEGHRLRVVLNVMGSTDNNGNDYGYAIKQNDPIVMYMERKISDTSRSGSGTGLGHHSDELRILMRVTHREKSLCTNDTFLVSLSSRGLRRWIS